MSRVAFAGRSAVIAFGLALSLVASLGCGKKFELPNQTPSNVTPGEDTYFVKFRWSGFAGATDLLMTRGGQVFVAEPRPGAPDSARVRIYQRSKVNPTPTGVELPDLIRPVRLAEGRRDTIFVLDDADPPAVRRYSPDGLRHLDSFSDDAWVSIVDDTSRVGAGIQRVTNSTIVLRGLAADAENNVFVAWIDSTFQFDRNLLDPTGADTTTSVVVSNTIAKYSVDGVLLETIATEGSGTGFVDGPGGIQTSGDALIYADINKNWVQLVDGDAPSSPIFFIDGLSITDDPGLDAPLDVAADDSGSIYIADTGNGRVLRFDRDGAFDQRVDLAAGGNGGGAGEAVEPVALTANTQLVYVLDRGLGEILVFELRSTLEDTE
ncbi:MAG: hypothetical protein ACKVU1_06575 [bacterium]